LTRVAVVDIGSNSTRLLIADVGPGGRVTELQRRSVVTRLGEGVEASGALGTAPVQRVHAVLEEYTAAIAEHGATAATAVMTSAVRDASNGGAFAAAVREHHGLASRTLSGDEEAQLIFLGATAARTPADGERLLVIDIGGGSTELVIGERGDVGFHVSTQVGVVRHSERHLHSDPPTPQELRALSDDAGPALARAVPEPERERVTAAVAVAGTATQCAGIDLGYAPVDVEGFRLSLPALEAMLARLAALPLAERREVPGLDPNRAPTIVAGVVVLTRTLSLFDLQAVEVSDRDLLWGSALQLAAPG
jgi:exopolyphosphatase / guanosine-5'-triphosphate,3'-diphosphate pyrophosphatase